uniref:Serpentine Receptor, class H n=1 Tax=Caenorhabditis tropicalis TaxID=1561998 RepID=A0A1I7UQZ0_9PELO
MVIFFYLPDENGVLHPNWTTLLVMSNVWFMSFSSMICVLFCGIKCYQCISKALNITSTQSEVVKNLQHQLFNALVIQTLIPFILMYTPLFFVFAFPLFNINFPYASSCISATISLYTAIDPLPSMFIIKAYKKAIIRTLIRILDVFSSENNNGIPRQATSTAPI